MGFKIHNWTDFFFWMPLSLHFSYNLPHFIKISAAESLTFGLLPPMAPGRMEPVSWYLQRILETQPWETRSWREMTHGRTPWWAISTILWRIWLGRGLPFMKTPPSWLTRPCPNGVETGQQCKSSEFNATKLCTVSAWLCFYSGEKKQLLL